MGDNLMLHPFLWRLYVIIERFFDIRFMIFDVV